jgi:hypothetical protein
MPVHGQAGSGQRGIRVDGAGAINVDGNTKGGEEGYAGVYVDLLVREACDLAESQAVLDQSWQGILDSCIEHVLG